MAFSYTGGAYNSGGSGSTSISVTHGLTINSGDLVVAYVHRNGSVAINNDAGGAAWTEALNENVASETARQAIFWKIAGASEPATYTWTLNGDDFCQAIVKVFTSSDDASVDSAASSARDTSVTTTMECTAINGAVISDNAVSLVFSGKDNRSSVGGTYTTATDSFTGVLGETANQATAGAHRIYTTGETFSGQVDITGATAPSDATYSAHISFVESTNDTTVNATTEALTITEQAATITSNVGVNVSTEALTIAENQAFVSLGVNIPASTENMVITENTASVVLDVDVPTVAESLVITERVASITTTGVTEVNASTEALLIAEQQAGIRLDVNTSVSTEALTIAENQASVTLESGDTNINASAEALSISTNIATVTSGATTLTPQDITNIVDAIFARVVENGETFAEQMKLIRAEAAGKLSVSGNTVSIRDAADSKDRIVATVDDQGQRTSITTDVS